MKENEHNKLRLNQLDEQVANTLRAVDKLTADMQELRAYTLENNKVVNAILRKLDDDTEQLKKNDEQFKKNDERFKKAEERIDKILEEMASDRKLRDAQFEFLLKKTGA